jgi:hypothetical protein
MFRRPCGNSACRKLTPGSIIRRTGFPQSGIS